MFWWSPAEFGTVGHSICCRETHTLHTHTHRHTQRERFYSPFWCKKPAISWIIGSLVGGFVFPREDKRPMRTHDPSRGRLMWSFVTAGCMPVRLQHKSYFQLILQIWPSSLLNLFGSASGVTLADQSHSPRREVNIFGRANVMPSRWTQGGSARRVRKDVTRP